MKVLFSIISQTVKGGIFFLLPILLFLFLFKKGLELIHPITNWIKDILPFNIPLSAFVLSVLLLLILCFLAGMIAQRGVGKKAIVWVEDNFLVLFPGYQLMKTTYESKVGLDQDKEFEVVLVPIDGWMIAFLVEEINNNEVLVFVPSAPSAWEGNLVIFEKSKIKHSDLKSSDILAIMKRLGVGTKEIFDFKEKKPSQN